MFKPGSYQNLGRARDFLQFWINSCDDRICARKGLIRLRTQPSNSITKSYDSIYHKQKITSNNIFPFWDIILVGLASRRFPSKKTKHFLLDFILGPFIFV